VNDQELEQLAKNLAASYVGTIIPHMNSMGIRKEQRIKFIKLLLKYAIENIDRFPA